MMGTNMWVNPPIFEHIHHGRVRFPSEPLGDMRRCPLPGWVTDLRMNRSGRGRVLVLRATSVMRSHQRYPSYPLPCMEDRRVTHRICLMVSSGIVNLSIGLPVCSLQLKSQRDAWKHLGGKSAVGEAYIRVQVPWEFEQVNSLASGTDLAFEDESFHHVTEMEKVG